MSEKDPTVVYVGRKPVMSYVLAIVTQLNQGFDKCTLKARGRAISTAVDAAEIVRQRFMTDADITSIVTGTEELEERDGRTRNVSTIEIVIERK